MTPYEIMSLTVAPVGDDGAPRCVRCVPIVGSRAPYMKDFNKAPVMTVDAAQPALCMCPGCGHKAQTPAELAVAILAERIARIQGAVAALGDRIAEQLDKGVA